MGKVPGTGGLSLRELARRTYRQMMDDDTMPFASAVAFHTALALFPFLIFLLALGSFLPIEPLLDQLLAWSRTVMPDTAMEPINEVVRSFSRHQTGALSLGALGALWAASGGVRAAMTALNRAYDLGEDRSALHRYLVSVAFTVGIGALLLAGVALMLLGPWLAGLVADRLELGGAFRNAWVWLRYPVAAVLLMLGASLGYTMLPNGVPFRVITPGAVVAVLLWILASLGFRLYLASFSRFEVLYGSVGAVVILLIFLWLSSLALLIGGELNGVIAEHGRERTRTGDA